MAIVEGPTVPHTSDALSALALSSCLYYIRNVKWFDIPPTSCYPPSSAGRTGCCRVGCCEGGGPHCVLVICIMVVRPTHLAVACCGSASL